MSFTVDILKEAGSHVVSLKNENKNCEAVIYTFGALLNAFSLATPKGRINVVDGFASPADAHKNITAGFKSAKLSPFVCRLDNGEYHFEGKKHKIDKFYLGNEAIHGLIYDAQFEIADFKEGEDNASVKLNYRYNCEDKGFPYAYTIDVVYNLERNNRLSITTTVKNIGNTNMPLSDGWHPYFCLGETVNDLTVQFNSNRMVEFDDRLLPTTNLLPNAAFEQPIKFGDTFLDNCFLLKNFDVASCMLLDSKTGIQLSITPQSSYPYLQVYTPPHRKSIAVENLSSPPDSFNNGVSLIVAKPGESYSFTTIYHLTAI